MAGGYNRPYGTNVAFAQAGKSLAQRQIDMQQFREAYLQANGTLVGADTEWSKYRDANPILNKDGRSEEHTSELQSLMRISYAVFCLKKKNKQQINDNLTQYPKHISHTQIQTIHTHNHTN